MAVFIERCIYPSLGECVYCRNSHGKRSEEHIIPLAIGGELSIEDASCTECKLKFDPVEGRVLNNMLGDFKLRSGFTPRSGRSRKGNIQITSVADDGSESRKKIPVSDYPRLLILPHFPPPETLFGRWGEAPRFLCITNKRDFRHVAEKHGAGIGSPVRVNVQDFCRLLAKIAHTHARAQFSASQLSGFDLTLPNIILSNYTTKLPSALVGCMSTSMLAGSDRLHELQCWGAVNADEEFLVVMVNLFTPLKTPEYHVVVGRRPRCSEPLFEAPLLLQTA